MSHEGIIYCKFHHKELFQPKVVKEDLVDVSGKNFTQDAISKKVRLKTMFSIL